MLVSILLVRLKLSGLSDRSSLPINAVSSFGDTAFLFVRKMHPQNTANCRASQSNARQFCLHVLNRFPSAPSQRLPFASHCRPVPYSHIPVYSIELFSNFPRFRRGRYINPINATNVIPHPRLIFHPRENAAFSY